MTQTGKSRSDELLIAALLAKPSLSSAAKAAGMSVRTAQRRMRDREFETKFREAKIGLIRQTTSRLTANASKAAEVLRKVFDDRKAAASARVQASTATIRLCLEGYELEELEARVRALEEHKNNASL